MMMSHEDFMEKIQRNKVFYTSRHSTKDERYRKWCYRLVIQGRLEITFPNNSELKFKLKKD